VTTPESPREQLQRYVDVAEALEALTLAQVETLTDIQATHWPW
jgi:hypothetical protein